MAFPLGVKYQIESWESYYSDKARTRLWTEHYAEFGMRNLKFSVNVDAYVRLDKAGALSITTCRDHGELIGYCVSIIQRHMHYDVLAGFEDFHFLCPQHRVGLVGYKLLAVAMDNLRRRGCKVLYFTENSEFDSSTLLKRMAFEPNARTSIKILET